MSLPHVYRGLCPFPFPNWRKQRTHDKEKERVWERGKEEEEERKLKNLRKEGRIAREEKREADGRRKKQENHIHVLFCFIIVTIYYQ